MVNPLPPRHPGLACTRSHLAIAAALVWLTACSPTDASKGNGSDGSPADAGSADAPDVALSPDAGLAPDAPGTTGEYCAAIASLVVASTSPTAIELRWKGAPGVTIQVARESYCGTDGYVTLATLAAGAGSYTDATVHGSWVYWYRITATDPATGMTASAAIAAQAAAQPANGCSGGATPRASGASAGACTGALDGGSAHPTDGGQAAPDGGDSGPTIHGTPCPIAAGASQATIDATLKSCGSGNTAVFAAGTYGPITSTITILCGVSLSGPIVPYSQTPNQAATIEGSSSFAGWGFQTTPGCSTAQTIQYLAWDGKQPGGAGGGGFLEIDPGTTNLTVDDNWLHGVNAPSTDNGAGQNIQANLINFAGGPGGAVTSNVRIVNNVFGSLGLSDCAGAITETATENGGGYCNGVGIGANVVNVAVQYNIFHWLEQGMKFYEGQGQCNPLTVSNNDYSHIQRIMYETQCNNATGPMNMNIQYNSFHDRGEPNIHGQQNYDLSAANGCTHPTVDDPADCVSHVDYNLDLQAPTGQADVGIEIWGGAGTTANYNYLQGYLYNGITWSASGQFTFDDNTFNLVNNGTGTNCATGPFSGFWNRENNGETATPTCTGNSFSNAITGTTASVAPVLSPASGTFSGSQVVTVTNPGTNRDTNTTDWCTTDGSTPVPGSGSAVGYYGGGTLTVTGSTTVKCVGMWGALNQPYSYPQGFGYVPSSEVSGTYTAQ